MADNHRDARWTSPEMTIPVVSQSFSRVHDASDAGRPPQQTPLLLLLSLNTIFAHSTAFSFGHFPLMGCAPSGSIQEKSGHQVAGEHHELAEWLDGLVHSDDPHNMLAAYVEIEKSIGAEEATSPAAAMGLAVTRQQQIKSLLQSATEKRDRSGGSVPVDNSIHELFRDLGLHRGASGVAAEHEEFIANINRRALNMNLTEILGKRLAATEDGIRTASLKVTKLQVLYEKQDILLGRIYHDAFGSEKERLLEEEIDTMRNYRDAFSSGAYQWEDCGGMVREAADLVTRGLEAWRGIETARAMEGKITMATEARDRIQEAVLLVQMSHDAMPGVQFPCCTKRELTSVSQAIEYVFTDILIDDRYRHALQVYKNFYERASELWRWINQILNSTLKKDLTDIDRSIGNLSRSLRNERIHIICERLGIENNYNQFGLSPAVNNIGPQQIPKFKVDTKDGNDPFRRLLQDQGLQEEFEKKLEARRNTMWPSRRIEELRMVALNHGQLP